MIPTPPSESPFTVERYLALVEQGLLQPDDRVELLDGVVVAMSPQNPAHASTVGLLGDALSAAVGDRAAIRIQLPLVLGPLSMPEPDAAVVPGRHENYRAHHPATALLVVEVADSSLPQDRITKARIYARAAIPELWIVNLRDGAVEVLREPGPHGYRERRVVGRGESIALAALPGVTVEVSQFLLASRTEDEG